MLWLGALVILPSSMSHRCRSSSHALLHSLSLQSKQCSRLEHHSNSLDGITTDHNVFHLKLDEARKMCSYTV